MGEIRLHVPPDPRVTAVHRERCHCPTCQAQTTVCLRDATDDQVLRMLQGDLDNQTGHPATDFLLLVLGDGHVYAVVKPAQREDFSRMFVNRFALYGL